MQALAPKLSRELRARLLYVDYRLLPEHTVYDAIADSLEAYKYLLTVVGNSRQIIGMRD